MKILVTGGSGFVGSETIKLLEANSHRVFNFDLMNGYDIRDESQLEDAFIDFVPDRVLHLAAIARFAEADANPELAFETNVTGTKYIVKLCQKHHIPLVYASTGSAYMPINDEPPIKETFPIRGNSVYGCSKALGEVFVAKQNPHIILRYGHLYGREKRYHGLIGGFLARIEKGIAPTLYGGKQSNDFLYIKDVAKANLLSLTAPWDKWNQAYNIGSGEELTAEAAGKMVCDVMGYTGKVEIKEGREVDAKRFVYDMTKAETMLGFKPDYTFEEGLKDMLSE